MTDRDALLRAVAAAPDDDTPRLVYADLMDDLGGEANAARARFIRLQVELARDAGRGWFARSDRLSEAAALAGRFAPRWLDELPLWATTELRKHPLGADDFPRGFLDALRVPPGAFRKHGDRLLEVAPIRKLDVLLSVNRRDVDAFVACPLLGRVRALAVRGAGADLVADCVGRVRTLHGVEELELQAGGLTDAGARGLAQAADLRSLRLLRAEGGFLSTDGVAALLNSPNLPALRTLDLHRNRWPDVRVGGHWEALALAQRLGAAFPGRAVRF